SGPPNTPACWPVTIATLDGDARRSADRRASSGAPLRLSWRISAAWIAARSRGAFETRAIVVRHASGSEGLPAKSGASRAKFCVYSPTSGRIHGKRRRSMASRTDAPAATASDGLGTTSIYYRRATISCSQGAPALPFDDASVVHPPPAFGAFRVLHQIGSGVLGPVFRSYDSQRERLVVIKAFRLDLPPSQIPVFVESLRGIVTRPVDAPGVVRAVDAGIEGNLPYLALEFVSTDHE